METVVIVVVVLLVAGYLVQQFAKFGQRVRGRDRCAFCGARLAKAPPGRVGFADHCRKCGRAQPWATEGRVR